MENIKENIHTNAAAPFNKISDLISDSLASFCDNDNVVKKIDDYVNDGFAEIVNVVKHHYVDAINAKNVVPTLLEFRIHSRNVWELSVTVGAANAFSEALTTYGKIEEHEVFRSRYRKQLLEKLHDFGFTPWPDNKAVLILSLSPRTDCGLI